MMEQETSAESLGMEIGNKSDESNKPEVETAEAMSTPEDPSATASMSKNQRKKLLKRQKWEEQKAQRRAYERQKKKKKRQAKKESGEPLPISRKRLKQNAMKNSACRVNVVIDCSFDHLMTDKDITQLVKQLNHCYAANRRVDDPLQFYITSLHDKTKERLDALGDYKGWDVYTRQEDYLEVFKKEDVVYLTSDSPHVLSTLEPSKAYVIGGLVDHNHQKGLCYRLAEEKGIAHAQLPISDYIELKTRKVLTINHVFEILVQFTQTHSWEKAFFKVIPTRKVDFFKSSENEGKSSPEESKSENESPVSETGVAEPKDTGCNPVDGATFAELGKSDKGDCSSDSKHKGAALLCQHAADQGTSS